MSLSITWLGHSTFLVGLPSGKRLVFDPWLGNPNCPPAFAKAEALFGEIPMATKTFSFGKDGKPFFMSGPNDSRTRIRNIMDKLVKSVGPDGFDYIVNVDGVA